MSDPTIQNDPRSTWDLINIALLNDDEEEADSIRWGALRVLFYRGTTEVFEAARSLCESPCPLEQYIGCRILAQLGGTERPFAVASHEVVLSVIRRTENLETLGFALCALGWLRDLRGVDCLLTYLSHPRSRIRYWVALALTALEDDHRSVDGLIRLMADTDVVVRDWATFGLGMISDQDTPAIREALDIRLDDPDDIVRGQALVGLAKRQDERVVEPLCKELRAGTYKNAITNYASEALEELGDLDGFPELAKWK